MDDVYDQFVILVSRLLYLSFYTALWFIITKTTARTLQLLLLLIMATLRNRAGHYIFALWFLSSFYLFSSPNLSGRRLDVYHTSTHSVALV